MLLVLVGVRRIGGLQRSLLRRQREELLAVLVELRTVEQYLHEREQVLLRNGLRLVVVERHVDDIDIRLDRGQHRDPRVVPFPADRLEHLVARHLGHPSI